MSIKKTYSKSKEYSNSIMSSINANLKDKNIDFTTNECISEIIVNEKVDVDDILNRLDIPKDVVDVLISVTELDDKTIIRQITK